MSMILGKRRRYGKAPMQNPFKRLRVPRPIYVARNRGDKAFAVTPVGNRSGIVKLKYACTVSLSQTVSKHIFRWNSLFDPDYTGTGHQPFMHDQLSGIWRNYHVLGARVRVRGTPGSGQTEPVCFGVYTERDVTSAHGNINQLMEKPGAVTALIAPSTAVGYRTVTLNWSAKKHFTVTNVLDESDLGAATDASPTKVGWLYVGAAQYDNSSAFTVECLVELEFIAIYHGRNYNAGS